MEEKRRTETIPYDHVFWVDGREEMCHATGYQVYDGQVWWNEYVNSKGEFEYGN